MDKGRITVDKNGGIVVQGAAVEVYRAHAVRRVLKLYNMGFPDRRIEGLTRRDALKAAGEMTGKTYRPSDMPIAIEDLNRKVTEIIAEADHVRE